jgi:hypothetical protein
MFHLSESYLYDLKTKQSEIPITNKQENEIPTYNCA